MDNIEILIMEMIDFDAGEPELIQHFMKVHRLAKLIGEIENVPARTMSVIEVAAVVHDIGIKVSMEKYGASNGKLQEQEGPAYAERMLEKLGYSPELIARVSYLVAHHHSYTDIDGIDYQILVEADFLVNFFENNSSKASIEITFEKIFKTGAGKALCRKMYNIK